LCKVWNCAVDDPKFDNVNIAQWSWYSEMILKEKKSEFERQIDLMEYLASFWNHEAVKKVREVRAQRENHAFKDDEEFEESILNESYKNDPLVQALKKIKEREEAERMGKTPREDYRKSKPPTDLSALSKLIKNF
jgi:hypothetical protein